MDGVEHHLVEEMAPRYLYKIVSSEDWKESQCKESLKLTDDDHDFIHFSTESQLNRIAEKYWGNVPKYIILKVDTTKIPGEMVFEANPGGSNKYYHLYNGSIPLSAVIESKLVISNQQ